MALHQGILDVVYHFLGILLFISYMMLVIAIVVRVVMTRRAIGVSLAWLTLIFTIPILGVSLYLLFGEIRLGRKRVERARAMYEPYARWICALVSHFPHQPAQPSDAVRPLSELVDGRLGSPMLSGNRVELLTEPHAILFALAQDIREASDSCYLEFYIWQPGGWVDQVAEALVDAAGRGVDCRVLLDSVGSAGFFRGPWPERLRAAGVKLVEVLPAGAWRMPLQRQDLRMHRKLVVIDDQVAYTGSMNLVDPRFFKRRAGIGQWIDVMLRLHGPIVPLIWSLFVRDWEMETGERLLDSQQHNPAFDAEHDQHLQLIPSGPFTGGDCIQQILLLAIYQARRRVVLTTPYFVPDDPLVAALRSAADRGVQVQLILPAKGDSFMARHASDAFLTELLSSGVEVYRFGLGLLHTKSVLVDEQLSLVGSVNLDRRSFWLNFETTLLLDDRHFAEELLALQRHYMVQARRLYLSDWSKRPWRKRLLENLLYLFSPLL
jgi:cardiolipin synthase A/B